MGVGIGNGGYGEGGAILAGLFGSAGSTLTVDSGTFTGNQAVGGDGFAAGLGGQGLRRRHPESGGRIARGRSPSSATPRPAAPAAPAVMEVTAAKAGNATGGGIDEQPGGTLTVDNSAICSRGTCNTAQGGTGGHGGNGGDGGDGGQRRRRRPLHRPRCDARTDQQQRVLELRERRHLRSPGQRPATPATSATGPAAASISRAPGPPPGVRPSPTTLRMTSTARSTAAPDGLPGPRPRPASGRPTAAGLGRPRTPPGDGSPEAPADVTAVAALSNRRIVV